MSTFESVTCGRCLGSGHYSYCQRYGTRCFKCAGQTYVLTKRGAAAAAYLRELLSKPASELTPGMKVRESSVTIGGDVYTKWFEVVAVKPDELNPGKLNVLLDGLSIGAVSPTTMFRVAATKEVKQAAFAKALEYQATLTKAGTVRKVASRAPATSQASA